jgi:surface antigen
MTKISAGAVLLGTALGMAVHAAQWNWLRNAPANYLTEEDWEILERRLEQALESGDDGDEVDWSNPATGHQGTLTPLDRFDADGTVCRNTRVFNTAGGVSNTGTYRFCRQADGSWKIAR